MKDFYELEKSPIEGIELSTSCEVTFLKEIKNGSILYIDKDVLRRSYNLLEVKLLKEWINEVLEYVGENKPKYTFEEAKEYMGKGGKAQFREFTFWFKDGILYEKSNDIDDRQAIISFFMLDNEEWELL